MLTGRTINYSISITYFRLLIISVLVFGKAVVLRRVLDPEVQPAHALSRSRHPQFGAGGSIHQLIHYLSGDGLPEIRHLIVVAVSHESSQVGEVLVRISYFRRARSHQGGVSPQVFEGYHVPRPSAKETYE